MEQDYYTTKHFFFHKNILYTKEIIMQQQTLTNQYLYNYAALCASDAPFLAQLRKVRYINMIYENV